MKTKEEIDGYKESPLFEFLTTKCGGKYWDKNDNSRVYMGVYFYKYMLQVDWVYDSTNRIIGVSLLGDTLPLKEGAVLMNDISKVRLYYDFHTEKVYVDSWTIPKGFYSEFCDLANRLQEYIDTTFEKGGQAREG